MGKNLFDFSKEKIENNLHNLGKTFDDAMKNVDTESIDEDTLTEASKIYDKYKDYSTTDLKKEFLSMSKKRLKDGTLTKEKLSSTLLSISPFLSPSQKDFLNSLLGELDD